LNYRHAFHAGSFADVVKHAVMVRILLHLRAKPAAFRVIDTHAGAGLYDLAGPEANRSPEWRAGIARLLAAPLGDSVRELLAPYLEVINGFNAPNPNAPNSNAPNADAESSSAPSSNARSSNAQSPIVRYPGSPAIVCAFLRAQDRLIACEREPTAAQALTRNLSRDRRAKAISIDGWIALNAYVPPPERRGLVLVDPPFEDGNDFTRLASALAGAHRKWPGGTYLLWYPIKGRNAPDALVRDLRRLSIPKILRAELCVGETSLEGPLGGCGLMIVNPPWQLDNELAVILPGLAAALGPGGALGPGSAGHRLDWIAREK
jgi:23S rRNA (adenine2030-N6)-methyltransferase